MESLYSRADEVIRLANTEIGAGYLDRDTLVEEIEDENDIVVISVATDDTHETITVTDPDIHVDGEIIGLQRVNYHTLESYQESHPFDLEPIFNEFDVVSRSDFPLYESSTTVVASQYRDEGVGFKLLNHAAGEITEAGDYPVIATVWQKANGDNSHIDLFASIGGTKIQTIDYAPDIRCSVCEELDCACNSVLMYFPQPVVAQIAAVQA